MGFFDGLTDAARTAGATYANGLFQQYGIPVTTDGKRLAVANSGVPAPPQASQPPAPNGTPAAPATTIAGQRPGSGSSGLFTANKTAWIVGGAIALVLVAIAIRRMK